MNSENKRQGREGRAEKLIASQAQQQRKKGGEAKEKVS
jgi:hypothetical protein